MFGKQIMLFRLMGFAVRADLSWLLVVVLLTWSLATGLFPQMYEGLSTRAYWLMGIAGTLILFLSIVVHELMHSMVARRYGIPMKGITLFVFGGVAEMEDEPPSPKAEFLMAAAGPAASLGIALVCLVTSVGGEMLGWRREVVAVIQYVGLTNLILAVFNMLPAFPLDGGRILRSFLWWRKGDLAKATRIASRSGGLVGWMLIVLGVIGIVGGNFIGGLWWFLIGTFLRMAAVMGYRHVVIRQLLEGQPVSRFMNAEPITVPRSISVAELVDDYIYRFHHKMFPVVDGERLIGCVTTSEVKKLPREEWDRQTVGAIMQSCGENVTISPGVDAMQALARMSSRKGSVLLVLDQERLVGILGLKDLLGFLSVKLDLEGDQQKTGGV